MKKVKRIIRIDVFSLLVMGLLVLYGCGNGNNAINETGTEDIPKMKSVTIFDNTYTIPDGWLVEEGKASGSVKQTNIYFEPPNPTEIEDTVGITLLTGVLSNGNENTSYSDSEDAFNILLPYILPSIFPNENDRENCTIRDYNLKESASAYIEGKNTDYNYMVECYSFFNNYNDVIVIQYLHSQSSKVKHSSEVKEMVDSIVFSYPGFKKEGKNQTGFTNKYGTPSTKCAHTGCNNYIASSGDTNCCEIHSNKCANCGKYIDEDAMYCMDCLKKGFSD